MTRTQIAVIVGVGGVGFQALLNQRAINAS